MSSTQSIAETIVVATDFSRHSDAAVQFALRRAKQLQAQLFVVHVLSADDADERRIALERLAHAIPAADQLETSAEQAVIVGPFHRRIVEFANQHSASLIVIGTRGRSGLAHLALGSVAERVVRSASCPVAVISGNHTDADAKIVAEPIPFEEIPNADTPAVDLLLRAVRLRATDIHFDPLSDREIQVRLRIDGQLERYCKLDLHVADHLTQQLKLMANLDIADPFHPKEGRLQLPSEHRDLEVRITTAPVVHGEAVALRIFSRSNVFFPLDRLGFSASAQTIVESILRKGEGIVLITGPTGSGKTTTVYSMLEVQSQRKKNIVSIEDPIEFSAAFVRQMAVDLKHDITMTSGLKTILRMDPDIIFVGEIRDAEAADIAMRAASSGRYVFSTLHTRDVSSTITALRDLRISNRSIAANVAGIVNQRLLRTICPHCKETTEIDDSERQLFHEHGVQPPDSLAVGRGCEKCRHTGHLGRVGVFEVASMTPDLAKLIVGDASENEVHELLRSHHVHSLMNDALHKVAAHEAALPEAMGLRWI